MNRIFLSTLLLLFITHARATGFTKKNSPKKIITITVNEKGNIFIGRDTLTSVDLTDELQKRLWTSYLGTDRMYDAIYIDFKGEVSMNTKETVKKAILEAQKKALTDLCLQKHKKLFDDLNNHQQIKIRKQFPVLFQQDF
jgi:biopolymer transport protein ExbD